MTQKLIYGAYIFAVIWLFMVFLFDQLHAPIEFAKLTAYLAVPTLFLGADFLQKIWNRK